MYSGLPNGGRDRHIVTAKANAYVDFGIELGKLMDIYENEQDLEDIKDRLTQIEAKLEHRSTSGRILKTLLIIFFSVIFLLLGIGVVQFVSNSSV